MIFWRGGFETRPYEGKTCWLARNLRIEKQFSRRRAFANVLNISGLTGKQSCR